VFLSTERRRALLEGLPLVAVPVLWESPLHTLGALRALIGPSRFKSTAWWERLAAVCASLRLDLHGVSAETDPSETMEGLYIKVEEEGRVVERYKLIRPSFLTTVLQSGSHWLDRPIVPNQLRAGVDLFGGAPVAPVDRA
jgi:hypothetical protein